MHATYELLVRISGAAIICANTSYSNSQILLFRPRCVEITSVEDSERDMMARAAADAATRIAEDLLTAGTVRFGQLHLYVE